MGRKLGKICIAHDSGIVHCNPSAQNARTRLQRIASLDGLRAVSIALVILGHAADTAGFPARIAFFSYYPFLGVEVFFVLSGFLITRLLLEQTGSNQGISLRDFYWRRAFRILPAAYSFILLVSLMAHVSARDIISATTFTMDFVIGKQWILAHLWTLSVEEQFYILWPIAFVLGFRYRYFYLTVCIFAAPFIRLAIPRFFSPDLAYSAFPAVADSIAFGCLLGLLWPEIIKRRATFGSPFVLLFTFGAIAEAHYSNGPSSALHQQFHAAFGQTLSNICVALTIANCVLAEYRILNLAFIRWLGVLSYSLYLWQQPFLNPGLKVIWTSFPLNILLAACAAIASYALVERPFLRIRDRFSRKVVTSS